MNKQWIEASHYHANHYRRVFSLGKEGGRPPTYEYLDVIGLFETGWIIYDFDKYNDERDKYGYPGNE